MSDDKPYIGGQAVIEGVMMRAPGCMTIAVRRPDGTIALQERPMTTAGAARSLWKLPFFRGIRTLVEAMTLGYRALSFSAEQQLTESERAEMEGSGSTRGAMVIAVAVALGLFVALPQFAAQGTSSLFGLDLRVQDPSFHLLTGLFKLLVVTAYIVGISRIPEIRRVFQYHGAEHKTIYAYEQGLPLTVENVQAQSTLHPRCGTTFIIVVVLVSILAGAFVTPLLLPGWTGIGATLMTLVIRIALLPVIAAVSYELQRLSARYCTTGPLRLLLWPGFAFQMITTREPDESQVEIAISAMRAAVWREDAGGAVPVEDEPRVFPSFDDFLASLTPAASKAPAAE